MKTTLLWAVAVVLTGGAVAGEPYRIGSTSGLYDVLLVPDVDELKIGEMHSWTLVLQDSAGQTVHDARISVGGGMPAHGHGLPTSPQVSIDDRGGPYRIDGLRFNMPGIWELRLTIDGAPGVDTAVLEFRM